MDTDSESKSTCVKMFRAMGIGSAHQSKHSMLHRRFKHDNPVPSVFDPPIPSGRWNNREMLEKGDKSDLENINEKSSDYIQRAKLKLRALTNVGMKRASSDVGLVHTAPGTGTRTETGTGHVDDKYSDFITRARMKMSAASNVGHGKSVDHVNDFSDDGNINRDKVKKRWAGKFVSFK